MGLILLAILLFVGVCTGTTLRWDQPAYEAMTHNMALTNLLGAGGGIFSENFTSSVPMLPRLYGVQVSILPVILAILLIVHFFLIKHHGMSPTAQPPDSGEALHGKLAEMEVNPYNKQALIMVGYGLEIGMARKISNQKHNNRRKL